MKVRLVLSCIGLCVSVCPCTLANNELDLNGRVCWTFPLKWGLVDQHPWEMLTNSGKREERLGGGELYRHEREGRELGIVCVWLDTMGQRLSHAFMNAYFKQSPSWANLFCLPEWGCWLKANYTLQIWPLVKTPLIWHSLDAGLGACLWASALDSHACVSTNHRGTRRLHAWWMVWGLCLWQRRNVIKSIYKYSIEIQFWGLCILLDYYHFLQVYTSTPLHFIELFITQHYYFTALVISDFTD